ncbi:hypothetical protein PSHT_14229, partial [Puccinia striiformis]
PELNPHQGLDVKRRVGRFRPPSSSQEEATLSLSPEQSHPSSTSRVTCSTSLLINIGRLRPPISVLIRPSKPSLGVSLGLGAEFINTSLKQTFASTSWTYVHP